jgi:hypothetical protein
MLKFNPYCGRLKVGPGGNVERWLGHKGPTLFSVVIHLWMNGLTQEWLCCKSKFSLASFLGLTVWCPSLLCFSKEGLARCEAVASTRLLGFSASSLWFSGKQQKMG